MFSIVRVVRVVYIMPYRIHYPGCVCGPLYKCVNIDLRKYGDTREGSVLPSRVRNYTLIEPCWNARYRCLNSVSEHGGYSSQLPTLGCTIHRPPGNRLGQQERERRFENKDSSLSISYEKKSSRHVRPTKPMCVQPASSTLDPRATPRGIWHS